MTGPSLLVAGVPDPAKATDARTGVVATVSARGITVALSGGVINAAHLDSYAPAVGDTVAVVKTQDSWLCIGRVVGSGTATDFGSPGSGIGPSVLAGMRTSGAATLASSTGVAIAVPRYNLTYYHPPGHTVLIQTFFSWGSTQNADWIIVDFVELVSAQTVGEWVQPVGNAGFGRGDTVSCVVPDTLAGAKRVVSMVMNRLTGTGTTSVSAVSTRPGYMIALDLGDKSVIIPT